MFLTSFMYCDKIEERGNNESALISPKSEIRLPFCPTLFSFCISIGLGDIEKNPAEKISIKFYNENQEQQFNLSTDLSFLNGATSAMLNLQVNNFQLKKEGVYYSNVYYGKEKLGKYPIRIVVMKGEQSKK